MKKARKFLATALAVTMSLSISVPTFAAEATPDVTEQATTVAIENTEVNDNDIMPFTIVDSGVVDEVGQDYKTIIYKPGGIGGKVNVRIISDGYNGWTGAMDIIVQNKNGNTIHQTENVAGIKADFTIDCGWDAARLELRIRPKVGAWTGDKHDVAWYIER